jgi:hypothetical protein
MTADWINEFATLLSGETIDAMQIERAMDIKDRHLPDKIYKFREVTSYALSNFRDDTVWMCSTDQYNDPFECSSKISFDRLTVEAFNRAADKILPPETKLHLSDDELSSICATEDPLRAMTYALLKRDTSIAPDKVEAIADMLFNAVSKVNSGIVSQLTAKIQKGMKVCSFSSRNDSLLMWGHYAKSHAGFCLEYDVRKWAPGEVRRRILHPVIYSAEIFDTTKYIIKSMDGGRFNNLFGVMAAIQKAKEWRYEDEWRFVLPMGETFANQNYSMPVPNALYIGARTEAIQTYQLTEIAASKGIPVFKARLSTTEFKMIFDPVKTP